jgi:hypothetical protein
MKTFPQEFRQQLLHEVPRSLQQMDEFRGTVHRVWRVGEHWCVVASNAMGFYLGYVSVPEGHPWREHDYDEPPLSEVDAHGGITFADDRDWSEFDSDDGVPPGFFVGFDCGHFCCAPIPGSFMAEHWIVMPSGMLGGHPAWDLERVAVEVGRLAVQAQVAAVVAANV